jgi:hypothetical protein
VADETAWLIELPEKSGPKYFQPVWDDDWTPDVNKALRFARKEDAERYIEHVGWNRAKAVEHMWCDPAPRRSN